MAFEEKTIDSKLVYEGAVFNVRKYKVTAVNDQVAYRDIVEHVGGSVIVGIKDDGNIVMVRQFRKALEKTILELPAGKRDPGEDSETTALREFREETGYTPGSIKFLTAIHTSVGYTTELLYIYLCRDLTPGETDLDKTEDIDLVEIPVDEALEKVMSGELTDSKTVVGLLFARQAGEI
ncbi:NUDIX domain-containing protein [Mobilibacterium timonense]|uniref:NUDIX domain-containing protein n=1 Tax=Mobilibacterium timonense TaxID=1871012 RepID=UPI003A8EE38F